MGPFILLRSLWRRIEEKFDQRGRASYKPDKDPDIRNLRMQRWQSERQVQVIKRPRLTGNPIADAIRNGREGNNHG